MFVEDFECKRLHVPVIEKQVSVFFNFQVDELLSPLILSDLPQGDLIKLIATKVVEKFLTQKVYF